ncbi:putative DNA repair protein XRCC1 [Penaeus vannamei]|uniref:Putative DNA repair protein XRCC1 n=1 Tax=Penaeus vannamei TaxID=6689 RepID=A0A3R7M864_PENVA|nr:putative DNA repair protein XRCC1 [Penaeus vannamei]
MPLSLPAPVCCPVSLCLSLPLSLPAPVSPCHLSLPAPVSPCPCLSPCLSLPLSLPASVSPCLLCLPDAPVSPCPCLPALSLPAPAFVSYVGHSHFLSVYPKTNPPTFTLSLTLKKREITGASSVAYNIRRVSVAGKTANGKLREEVGAKRAKVEASGDEPKKTVNGRKEGAGKERETSPASVAEGWEKRKGGKRVEKEGKTVERKEAEANGFAKGGNYKQEEDEDYDADTDVDEDNKKYLQPPDTSALPLPSLGDYFAGKTFFIYGRMDENTKKMVRRYIIAFNGTLEEYMTGEVQYVITEDEWDENFDAALEENASLQFVKPAWIWKCSNKGKLVPHQPFLVHT